MKATINVDDSGVVALTTDSQILDILESDINVANSYKFKKIQSLTKTMVQT